ncbi:hypothetical protein RB195_002024 [Necator americanus]|uniref:Uncharacterized protein n=1 Tax=Necator americanus TaxID=51031 RepID=A0ABR1DH86_NECAM
MFSKCRTDAFRKMSMKCFALSYNIKKEERLLEMHKSNFVENGTNINFRSSVKASEANSTESLKSGFSRTFRLYHFIDPGGLNALVGFNPPMDRADAAAPLIAPE